MAESERERRDLTANYDLTQFADGEISRSQARQLLKERFSAMFEQADRDRRAARDVTDPSQRGMRGSLLKDLFFTNLANALPEEMLNEDLLRTADLRPFFAQMMLSTPIAQAEPMTDFNGVGFSRDQRHVIGNMLVLEQQRVRGAMEDSFLDTENPASAEEIVAKARAVTNEWREAGTWGKVPTPTTTQMVDPNTNQVINVPGATTKDGSFASIVGDIMSGAATNAAAQPRFMNQAEVEFLFRNNSADAAMGILQQAEETAQMGAREAGFTGPTGNQLRLNYDENGTQYTYDRTQSKPLAQKQYTLTEALNLPFKMNRHEIRELSRKMEAAGFFDLVGSKPLINGDATDPAFKDAYRALLSKSIQTGRSVTETLKQQMTDFEDAVKEKMQVRLMDPARIRMDSDSLGQAILGRKLTGQEHTRLVKAVHDLQRTGARGEFDTAEGGEFIDPDIEARISDMIREENVAEASAKDVSNQYDIFSRLLAGPGRGVG